MVKGPYTFENQEGIDSRNDGGEIPDFRQQAPTKINLGFPTGPKTRVANNANAASSKRYLTHEALTVTNHLSSLGSEQRLQLGPAVARRPHAHAVFAPSPCP
jgi:hypothetical protein